VTEIIEDRRREPRDDLVSILVGANDSGILGTFDQKLEGHDDAQLALANNELIMLLVILLVAGNETTRNGLSGGMQLLIENPGERKKLLDSPELLPSAVEEMVRLVSPVHSFARTVTRDTTLRDKQLEAGQRRADALSLGETATKTSTKTRRRSRVERNALHLGFGLGPHFLPRREPRADGDARGVRGSAAAFPGHGIRRRVGPRHRASALVRSCVQMNLRFTPER